MPAGLAVAMAVSAAGCRIEAWDRLPAALRAGIVAMVKAASK
jgi:hypothetical protein